MVFVAVLRLSLVLASWGYSSLKWMGFSCGAQALGHMGFSSCGKWFSCSTARGIFLDQGWNPCPLHCKADSSPLDHQGSLALVFDFKVNCILFFLVCVGIHEKLRRAWFSPGLLLLHLLLVDSLRMAIMTEKIWHLSVSLSFFFFFQKNTFVLLSWILLYLFI